MGLNAIFSFVFKASQIKQVKQANNFINFFSQNTSSVDFRSFIISVWRLSSSLSCGSPSSSHLNLCLHIEYHCHCFGPSKVDRLPSRATSKWYSDHVHRSGNLGECFCHGVSISYLENLGKLDRVPSRYHDCHQVKKNPEKIYLSQRWARIQTKSVVYYFWRNK